MFKKRGVDKSNIRKRESETTDDNDDLFRHAGSGGHEQQGKEEDEGGANATAAAAAKASTMSKSSLVGGSTKAVSGVPVAVQIGASFESNKDAAPLQMAGHATYTSEIDTATDRDARAILERTLLMEQDSSSSGGPKEYRGQASYEKTFLKKDATQVLSSAKMTGTQGPIRAPAFLRASTRFDYQPDICKDYKETGFCGYGDSCKFMHDRGDYKSGWQQEKEWDEQQAKKKKRLEEAKFIIDEDGNRVGVEQLDDEGDDAVSKKEEDKDALPFACLLCRGDFKNPVVTNCGHYFCSRCIVESNKTSLKCPAPGCGKQTFGVFNKAHKLIKKLAEVKGGGVVSSTLALAPASSARGNWEDV